MYRCSTEISSKLHPCVECSNEDARLGTVLMVSMEETIIIQLRTISSFQGTVSPTE